MVEFEADDALATAALHAASDAGVERVVICSPDKDLTQCVRDGRIVCYDRRRRITYDEAAVMAKFGVPPRSIPDWLALVGDSADGIPGVPRWGPRSAAVLLARYGHVDSIPDREAEWTVPVRGAASLTASLREYRVEVLLYRRLATLRTDVPLEEPPAAWAWRGAERGELTALCNELGADDLIERVSRWRT
jgi:5'-3' exonuclease